MALFLGISSVVIALLSVFMAIFLTKCTDRLIQTEEDRAKDLIERMDKRMQEFNERTDRLIEEGNRRTQRLIEEMNRQTQETL